MPTVKYRCALTRHSLLRESEGNGKDSRNVNKAYLVEVKKSGGQEVRRKSGSLYFTMMSIAFRNDVPQLLASDVLGMEGRVVEKVVEKKVRLPLDFSKFCAEGPKKKGRRKEEERKKHPQRLGVCVEC